MRHKSETQAPGRSRDTYASYNYERELALKVVLQIMRCYATVSVHRSDEHRGTS